jgi:hypothetical protein
MTSFNQMLKDRIRQAEWRKLSTPGPSTTTGTPGSAAGETVIEARPSAPDPSSATTGTSASATGSATSPMIPASLSTSAISMSASSSTRMAWTESPSGCVDRGSIESMPDLNGLPDRLQKSLRHLATGSNQSPEAVIWEIASFFVESEDERAEGTLLDAVVWYLENMLMPETTSA